MLHVSSVELPESAKELEDTMTDNKKESDTLLEEEKKKCVILTGEVSREG